MRYRTALITGASSGIGRSVARRLARDGAEVVLSARRIPALEALADEIRGAGGEARVLALDVADTEATVAAIRAMDDAIGGLDLIFANAGVGLAIRGTNLTWEKIRDMCMVNFNGAIATLSAVLPRMVARGSGHLVGVSSIGALAPFPLAAGYGGSKVGVTMFLECLRLDLKGTGVSVTCVHPGAVKTEMTAYMKKDLPMGMEANEAADLIVDRLRDAPPTIDFPFVMAATARSLAALPRPVRDAALLRFPVPDENG